MQKNRKLLFPVVPQLIEAIAYIYEPAGLLITTPPEPEKEGEEYAASRLSINYQFTVFRMAKTTPKKIGQFVTFWKRNIKACSIVPFDSKDAIHWLIVHVYDEHHQGQFIFPRSILLAKKIISKKRLGGKRGFRVYPPWVLPNKTLLLLAKPNNGKWTTFCQLAKNML